jgi:hypothetical protein
MRTLAQDARTYLEAGGYRLLESGNGFFSFKNSERDTNRHILIWCDDETRPPSTELDDGMRARRQAIETTLLQNFEAERSKAPGAAAYYLVASRQGYSQSFVTEATRILGRPGGIRVPVEFFDSDYRIESAEGRRARSVLGNVLMLAAKVRRVAQPFTVRTGPSEDDRIDPGSDLVEHLDTAMRDPVPNVRLRIIDGAAGSGKTVAFNALATALYEEFMAAKKARHGRARPILFLPEHLRGKRIGYVDDILAAVADTDMAEPTTPNQAKWLLNNGHAIWMFDGLDEFYGGGSDFFSFVEEALQTPGSKAQFVICARDSLQASAPAVRAFVERQLAAGRAEIYELRPWTADAWRQLAWLELEQGRQGAHDSPRVQQFVSSLERWSEIAAMARLPFYCRVLLSHFCQNGTMPRDEFEILELLVGSMIRREHGKHVFQWQDFVDVDALAQALEDEMSRQHLPVPQGEEVQSAICRLLDEQAPELLFELIGGLAHRIRHTASTGAEPGFSIDDARNLITIGSASSGHDNDILRRLRLTLVRFAFFGPGRKVGSLDFTHDILAEYFAARYAMVKIETALHAFAGDDNGIGRATGDLPAFQTTVEMGIGTIPVVPRSLFHRYFARQVEQSLALRTGLELILERGTLTAAHAKDFLELLLGRRPAAAMQSEPPPLPSQPFAVPGSTRLS